MKEPRVTDNNMILEEERMKQLKCEEAKHQKPPAFEAPDWGDAKMEHIFIGSTKEEADGWGENKV